MMWLILTPFLVLCLAALGLTLVELADYIGARSWKRTNSRLSGDLRQELPFERRPSFYPGEIGSYVSTLSTKSLASPE